MIVRSDSGEGFDTFVFASDWRYAAIITGLMEYLDTFGDNYIIGPQYNDVIECEDECLQFNSESITKTKYIEFVNRYFGDKLAPCKLIQRLQQDDDLTEDEEKEYNTLLTSNTILKRHFAKKKITKDTRREILDELMTYRDELILETYRNKNNMYKNFANPNMFLKEGDKSCRLNGYYIDMPKKGRSQGFGFSLGRVDSDDDILFDFVPFAFQGGRTTYFVNAGYSIDTLHSNNKALQKEYKNVEANCQAEGRNLSAYRVLGAFLCRVTQDKARDIEVIVKNQDKDYFETLYVRKNAIDILKWLEESEKIKNTAQPDDSISVLRYTAIARVYKSQNSTEYIDVQKNVLSAILNNTLLDYWIEYFLKEREFSSNATNIRTMIRRMIEINRKIRMGGEAMNKDIKIAYACAQEVRAKLEENKLRTYRSKLLNAVISKNYDKAQQILVHLSLYTNVTLPFTYSLFEDFEKHKDIFYTFIEALGKPYKEKNTVEG